MKIAQKSILRIKEMIRKDKEELSSSFLSMIKSDIYNLLNSYFNLSIEDIDLKYSVNEEGLYNLQFSIKSNSVKKINFINNN